MKISLQNEVGQTIDVLLIYFHFSWVSSSIALQSKLLLLKVKALIVLTVDLTYTWLLNNGRIEAHGI